MALNESKFNRGIFLTAIAAAVLLLAFAGYRTLRPIAGRFFGDFFYPYLALARVSADRLSDQSLLVYSRVELAARVEQLTRINRRLAANASTAAELTAENAQLRRLLKLSPTPGWQYVPAEIILRDPLLWNEHFTIDRGRRDGVVDGAAVMSITPDGRPVLAGIIDRAGDRTSEVVTLFSPALRLSAALPGTGTTGLLNTGERHPAGDGVPIGYLPARLTYTPSEVVMTTGFERHIPGGIKIGELVSVDEQNPVFSNLLHLSGIMKPAVQLDSIRFLIVARRAGGTPRPEAAP